MTWLAVGLASIAAMLGAGVLVGRELRQAGRCYPEVAPPAPRRTARLHELAGQRFLIEAFARLRRRHHDVRLVICGTGALRPTLERLARDQGVAEFVTFTGLLPNARIAQYAAVADVFALPSLLEALPTVAVEALAAGTPVVSRSDSRSLSRTRTWATTGAAKARSARSA